MGKQEFNFFAILLLILISTFPLIDALYPGKLEGVDRTIPILHKILLLFFLFVYFIMKQKRWWFRNSIGRVLTVFIVTHILYFLFTSQNYTEGLFQISKTLTWYFGFFFFLDIGFRQQISYSRLNVFFTITTVSLFLLVFFGVTNELLFKINRNYGASNFAYYLLFIFPFLFMNKVVPYRSLIFTIISIGVAISFKRGTIFLFLIMIIYLIFFSKLKEVVGKRFSHFFKLFIIFVISGVFYTIVLSNLESYVDKFSDLISSYNSGSINDDTGSGRGLLYALPLERWINSYPFNFILGYGFNSAPDYYESTTFFNKKMYAHSDFVMILHDYGLVGLSILLSLFMSLFKLIKKSISNINKLPLILIFLALLTKALFSGFILYEYSIYAFAILGLILGRRRRLEPVDKFHNEQ